MEAASKMPSNKPKNERWNYIKLKRVCSAKEAIPQMKKERMEWEKTCASHEAGKGLTLKIYKFSHNSIAKKPNSPI